MYVHRYTTYFQYVYLPFLPVVKNILLLHLGVFFGNASVDADFIRVEVVTSSGETKSDVHMHVFPKKEVLERKQKQSGIPLNVALIMFDSTSAANFKRKMPKSLEYLTTSLDSILMQGKCACMSLPWFYGMIVKYSLLYVIDGLQVCFVFPFQTMWCYPHVTQNNGFFLMSSYRACWPNLSWSLSELGKLKL